MWQNTIGSKTRTLTVNKSVASLLLGVARLYLIIIVHNAAHVSRAHKKLKFRAESAVQKYSFQYNVKIVGIPNPQENHESAEATAALCVKLFRAMGAMGVTANDIDIVTASEHQGRM